MGVKEDRGSELTGRHLFQGSALAVTTSLCLDMTALCPHLEAWVGNIDHFPLCTVLKILVDK